MSYDRADFKAQVAQKAMQRQSSALPAMRALQVAGVIAAKLTTGSEEWNRYLSYLQGQIEKAQERKGVAHSKMADPSIWEPYQLNKLKADILQADAMIAAWQWAMELPKALVDGAKEAEQFLNKLDRENDKAPAKADS